MRMAPPDFSHQKTCSTKAGDLGGIYGGFGALRGAPRVTDGRLRWPDPRLGRWKHNRFEVAI